jgi:hypothetical protein
MSYRSQLYPLSSTSERMSVRSSWGSSPANSEDMRFLRSWLVYDSQIRSNCVSGRSNRSIAVGLGLAIVISASFWAGVAFLIARVWN